MSNCKADLSIGHQIINLQDPDGIWDVFEGILMVDNDLRDNGPMQLGATLIGRHICVRE